MVMIRARSRNAPPPPDETVSGRVRRLREDLGWTQRELADMAGVSIQTVSRAENHRDIRASSLLAMLKALGLPLDALWRAAS